MDNLIKCLNEYLSDLKVFATKLQNYHWNVKGKDFFIMHQKLEEMIHAEILSLNGMLERNPVWKQKYASTYRPMLRKITIGEIWKYDKSFRNKVIWSIIRICPTLYPYLRQIKRAIFRH